MPEVRKLAYILAFLFVTFLATPTFVVLIDKSADVSMAFSVNEEESSKTQINLEFQVEESPSNYASIHFLQEQKNPGHYYAEAYPVVCIDVISPPPRQV
ncbi:MAG TPA: hypothetical protein VLO29_02885 [Salegentibacter sp.]|nr:hypothetical protein [Salegentibacter sp.]